MRTRFIMAVALMFGLSPLVKAQTFEVPKNYVLKAKTDYAQYEADIIKCVDWLQKTSWADQQEKRMKANTFLVEWVTGSPDVNIEVTDSVMKMCELNKELLFSFMGGYTKYALENKNETDPNKPIIAGIKTMLEKYETEKVFIKDEEVEKLIKISRGGKLNDWIARAFPTKS